MRKEISYIPIALLLILVASMFTGTARAFVYPNPPPNGSLDTLYELYGPHIDQILCKEYASNTAEYDQLLAGAIDFCDTPLTSTYRTTAYPAGFKNDPNVLVENSGGQYNYYVIDFNLDNQTPMPNPMVGPRPNPVWNAPDATYTHGIPPITSDQYFRLACASLFNRTQFIKDVGDAFIPIFTPIPSYMTSWIWTGCPNYTISDDYAISKLNQGCIYKDSATNPGQWYWDYNTYLTGSNATHTPHNPPSTAELAACQLMLISRADTNRYDAGELLYAALTRIGFGFGGGHTYGFKEGIGGTEAYQLWGLDKNYLMATLGWTMVGPNPDFLYAGYNGANFYDDSGAGCPDQSCLNDSFINTYTYNIMYAKDGASGLGWVYPTGHDAWDNCYLFQQRFFQICPEICMDSPASFMASSKFYTGGNNATIVGGGDPEDTYRKQNWLGVCNALSVGTGTSWFTYLNAYPNGSLYGDGNMTARMGWMGGTGFPVHLNPVYSEWAWDAYVLGWIYDAPGYRDPYSLAWKTDLITSWTTSQWYDSASHTNKTAVAMTLRPDVYWSDGVPVTIADVIFSLVTCGPLMVNMGMTPPWWWPTAQMVQSMTILTPDTVQILFNAPSCWAEGWALGGFYIIPEHIWKSLILGGVNMVQYAPDPNMIATGPFRYVSHTVSTVSLVANKPSSKVKTDNPASSSAGYLPYNLTHAINLLNSPIGYHNYCPIYIEKSLPARFDILSRLDTVTGTFTVTLTNKLLDPNATLQVNKTVLIDNVLQTDPHANPISVVPGYPDVETFSYNFGLGEHNVSASAVVVGPLNIIDADGHSHANPWIGQVISDPMHTYVTRVEDIGGSNYYIDIDQERPGSTGSAYYALVGQTGYNVTLAAELPTPDFLVNLKDVFACALAFGTTPGMSRWNAVCDVNKDYIINLKDYYAICLAFGSLY